MTRRFLALPALALAGVLALAGCTGAEESSGSSSAGSSPSVRSAGQPRLSASGGYMRQPTGDMAAGFLVLTNEGDAPATLTGVSSDIGPVTTHETVDNAMRETTGLKVPAHGQLVFKSGGLHLMFEKLERKPKEGETVTVTLDFDTADPLTVELAVKETTYTPESGH